MELFKVLVKCTPEGIDYLAYLYRGRMSRIQHYRVIALFNQAKANSSANSAKIYKAPIEEEEKGEPPQKKKPNKFKAFLKNLSKKKIAHANNPEVVSKPQPARKNLIEEEFKEGEDGNILEQEISIMALNEDLTDYALVVMEKTLEVIYKSVNEIPLFIRAFLKITYESWLASGKSQQECQN